MVRELRSSAETPILPNTDRRAVKDAAGTDRWRVTCESRANMGGFLLFKQASDLDLSDVAVGIGEVIVGYSSLMTPWMGSKLGVVGGNGGG